MKVNNLNIDIPDIRIPFIKINDKNFDYCDIVRYIKNNTVLFSPKTFEKYNNMELYNA